jgi:hypothetical protein
MDDKAVWTVPFLNYAILVEEYNCLRQMNQHTTYLIFGSLKYKYTAF